MWFATIGFLILGMVFLLTEPPGSNDDSTIPKTKEYTLETLDRPIAVIEWRSKHGQRCVVATTNSVIDLSCS